MCMEREGMTACLVSHCACRVGVSHRHHLKHSKDSIILQYHTRVTTKNSVTS